MCGNGPAISLRKSVATTGVLYASEFIPVDNDIFGDSGASIQRCCKFSSSPIILAILKSIIFGYVDKRKDLNDVVLPKVPDSNECKFKFDISRCSILSNRPNKVELVKTAIEFEASESDLNRKIKKKKIGFVHHLHK